VLILSPYWILPPPRQNTPTNSLLPCPLCANVLRVHACANPLTLLDSATATPKQKAGKNCFPARCVPRL